jgi:hypothetical protein
VPDGIATGDRPNTKSEPNFTFDSH